MYMERVGHLLYLLLFFNAESQLILMIHFITAGKFWSIIKFQTDGQTRGGGAQVSIQPLYILTTRGLV